MLAALREVVLELASFALNPRAAASQLTLPPPPRALPAATPRAVPREVKTSSAAAAAPAPVTAPVSQRTLDGVTNYIDAEVCEVHLRPARTLDGVLTRLVCGTEVRVLGYQGRWAEIGFGEHTAWVLKDDLTDDRSVVFPELEEGIIYDSLHPDTERIRRRISNTYGARELNLPLLDIEYVTYRLTHDGRTINWPTARPRAAGRWREVLRGGRGAHLSVQPTTRSVIEMIDEDGAGSVAYVESVRPNETITIAMVGHQVEGRFARRTLEKSAWQALRPVFIEIR